MSQAKRRKAFTFEEDERLRLLIASHGEDNWDLIVSQMPGRTRRQCRERWSHYLCSTLTNGPWTIEDDLKLMEEVGRFGTRWRAIMSSFPGRTDVNIRNRWNVLKARHARIRDAVSIMASEAKQLSAEDVWRAKQEAEAMGKWEFRGEDEAWLFPPVEFHLEF